MTSDSNATRRNDKAIAIIGMACLYPGARDVDQFWRNILHGVDSVTDPPVGAWDPDVYYEPGSTDTDRIYVKKGGYIEDLAQFDPLPFGVPPKDIGGEPDQWLALKLARDALQDAGYADADEEVRHRTAVILGRGLYPNAGSVNAIQHTLIVTQTLDVVRTLQPDLTDDEVEAIRRQLLGSLPKFGADTAPALTPNMITGRIANRLDLMGPNYTVDAACASSLIAMKMASRELLNGDCDMALAGGSQVWTSMPILGVFGQMGALSRSEQIRPFDKNADGTILGEGIAFLVLKRLADAERDKDRIYAVIRGIGVASDGRASGLMAPRVEGQVLAMRRAYEDAGVSPETIELIEAHGTGTPVGDAAEVKSMTEVFGSRSAALPHMAIGSVKSMIGHTMPAAGAAGMIKASLSLYHKVLPPTLNYDEPNPELHLDETPFFVNTSTRRWVHGREYPRRAGVNAFGFGGINSHVILEEYVPAAPAERDETADSKAREVSRYLPAWDSELCVLTADSREDLAAKAAELSAHLDSADGDRTDLLAVANTLARRAETAHGHRLAIVATSLDDLQTKVRRARERLSAPECRQIREAAGVYYTSEPLRSNGKIAFLFPGEGSQYVGMLSELALHFPEARTAFDDMDALHDSRGAIPPSTFLHPPASATAPELEAAQEYLWTMDGAVSSVLASDEAMLRVLRGLGVQPDAVAGHSSGEYAALRTAGVFNGKHGFDGLAKVLMDVHQASLQDEAIEPAALVACGTDRETAELLLARNGIDGFVAMDNCPNQVVIVLREDGRDQLMQAAREQAIIVEPLKFDRPYHTAWFSSYSDRLSKALAGENFSSPSSVVYSCATASTVSQASQDTLRDLVAGQWSEPVEFRRMIERMYEDGFRIFVEVGPGNHLTSFVEDILRGKRIGAFASNVALRSDLTQLNHLAGLLFVHGVDIDIEALSDHRIDSDKDSSAGSNRSPTEVTLTTGFTSMKLDPSALPHLQAQSRPAQTAQAGGTETESHYSTEGHTGSVQGQVQKSVANPFEEEKALSSQASPPAHLMPIHTPLPVQSDLAAVTHRFLETMDHFLAVQERVLLAYLGSGANSDGATLPLSAHTSPALPAAPASYANGNGYHPSYSNGNGLVSPPPAAVEPPAPAPSTPAPASFAPAPAHNGNNGSNGTTNGHRPSPVAQTPVEDPPEPVAAATSSPTAPLPDLLRQIVSDRTGYPAEVVDVNADLEADLGIDSIKRVEILGTLRSQDPSLRDVNLEQLTVCRTIQQIVDVLSGKAGTSPFDFPSVGGEGPPAEGNAAEHWLLGKVLQQEPGRSLVTRLVVDPGEATWLQHHTIGRDVSTIDESLMALPVMPLALSLELMSQAASTLLLGRVVTRIEQVRARQWIEFGDGARTLEVRAERNQTSLESFHCQILLVAQDDVVTPAVEAEVVLESAYPAAPKPRFAEADAPSRYGPADLYEDVMYHGPTWRAVTSIRGSESASLTATLSVPGEFAFRNGTDALMSVTDPIALDAAGQLIGFWTAEHLERGRLVFPISVAAIEFFGQPLAPRESLACTASIGDVDELRVQADFDVIGPTGVQFRVSGWLDRRFHLPQIIEPVVRPRALPWLASEMSTQDLESTPDPRDVYLKLDAGLEDETGLLRRVWASRIRSRPERAQTGLAVNSTSDLLKEHLAKEAICRLLRKNLGMELLPADVELVWESDNEVRAVGSWSASLSAQPAVWLARQGHTLVAVASLDSTAARAKSVVASSLTNN